MRWHMVPALLITVVVLLAACSGPPDFETANGVGFYLNGQSALINRDHAELAESSAVSAVAAALNRDPHEVVVVLYGLDVQGEAGPFLCSDGKTHCAAEHVPHSRLIRLSGGECSHAAYRHELLHFLLERLTGDGDPGHQSRIFVEDMRFRAACHTGSWR